MEELDGEIPESIKVLLELWIIELIKTTVPQEVLEKIGFSVEKALKNIGVLE